MGWELYAVALDLAEAAARAADRIRRKDTSLARQLRRAVASVPLNLMEGSARTGGDRRHLYTVAFGSAREVLGILQTARRMGCGSYPEALELADRVCAMAYRASR
jgi:four helix bundle protein